MAVTIRSLLTRGDYLAVEAGRLVITPKSGKPIPKAWAKQNTAALVAEIAKLVGVDVFEYRSYATGIYGERKWGGLRLDYASLLTGSKCAAIFNVLLTRERARGKHKKGDPLPDKQFRVSKNHGFVALWNRLGLEPPRSLTEWHDHMGKLKPVYVVTSLNENGKLANDTIAHFEISLSGIENLIGKKSPDKFPIMSRYVPDNSPIRTPDKVTAQTQAPQGLQENLGACANSHILSKQVSTCKESLTSPLSNTYRELDDRPFVAEQKKLPQDQSVDEWLADYEVETRAEKVRVDRPRYQPVESIPKHLSDWMDEIAQNYTTRLTHKISS
jgi:hypothetical protein